MKHELAFKRTNFIFLRAIFVRSLRSHVHARKIFDLPYINENDTSTLFGNDTQYSRLI